MSSGFLLSEALSQALRKPYHRGDVDVTVQYLVEGLTIGEYRVMLKRNFDTACWVPPAGSRDSHSIYYGDRMVSRVVDFFLKKEKIEGVPDQTELAKMAQAKLAKPATGKPPAKLTLSHIQDEKLEWLAANLSKPQWTALVDQVVKAVKSYGRHERQHARETPRDLKVVTKDLKALGIPFMYFNLFEDARIEHISRQELGDPFDWLDLEDIAPPDNPFNMLLRCIQLEGAADEAVLDCMDPFKGDPARTVSLVAENVEGYYKRAVMCAQAEQLYPIIVEFLKEFKEDLPPPPDEKSKGEKGKGKGEGGGSSSSGSSGSTESKGAGGEADDDEEENGAEQRAGDLTTAAEAAEEGDKFFQDFEADAEVVGGTDSEGKKAEAKAKAGLKGNGDAPPPKGSGSAAQGIPDSIAPQASGGRALERQFLAPVPGKLDDVFRKRVDHLTEMLMRMFKTHSLPAYTENESRRMSSRHLARGEIKYVHKKVFGGKGKRKYSIVFDCSGSMGMNGGKPAREGKLLLLALNNLARRGYLEGHLILSGYPGGAPGWLQYKFPVKDELVLRIATGHSSEGLQNSLEDNLKELKGMDDVFVYTDACITDTPLNRDKFARHGIYPVGLYVGDKDLATEMDRHFPQNIIRDTIEDVVETMLTRNRRTVG